MTASISERDTTVLLCTWCLLVVPRVALGVLAVIGVLDRAGNVEHRQHHEDEGLKDRDQDLQWVEEAHREDDHDEATQTADDRPGLAARERPADETVEPH